MSKTELFKRNDTVRILTGKKAGYNALVLGPHPDFSNMYWVHLEQTEGQKQLDPKATKVPLLVTVSQLERRSAK